MNQAPAPPFVPEDVYRAYLDGLLANNRQQCQRSFEQWLEANAGLRSLYEDLVQRSLSEVGELWEQGKISVATEHAATAICESLLNLCYPRLIVDAHGGRIWVESTPGHGATFLFSLPLQPPDLK